MLVIGWALNTRRTQGFFLYYTMEIKRKFHDGQIVWVCRSEKDKPHAAKITGVCGVSSTGNVVYNFEYYEDGFHVYSGAADYDIYETEKAAKKQYRKYKILAIFELLKRR